MKSFKSFLLTEKQQRQRTSDVVFSRRIDLFRNPMPVFLSPTMFKRLQMTKEELIGFHSTDLDGAQNIIKIQNSSKSISTSLIFDYHRLMRGIETDGGVMLILQGDVLLRSDFDAFTYVTQEGRRFVNMGLESNFIKNLTDDQDLKVIINRNAMEFQNQLFELYERLMKKYRSQFAQFIFDFVDSGANDYYLANTSGIDNIWVGDDKGVSLAIANIQQRTVFNNLKYIHSVTPIVREMQSMNFPSNLKGAVDNMIKKFNKAKSGFIADYIDGTEKILKDNDMFRQLFFMTGFYSDYDHYDEMVMTNFELRYVYINYGSPNIHIDDIKAKFIKNSTNIGRNKKFIDFVASKLIDNETLKRYIEEAKQVFFEKFGKGT